MNQPLTLEVCVDSIESAMAAQRGGAHRIELCSALDQGGVTPSSGLMDAVRQQVDIALHVMIRPRASDFCYSEFEFQVMQRDILIAKKIAADGVVLGILDLDGKIDLPRTKQLVELADPLRVTFHRAFDMSLDLLESLRDLQNAGVHRVLSSGGKQTAAEGSETLRRLVDAANGTIGIMAAGGIKDSNIAQLLESTGVREIHASLRSIVASPMRHQNRGVSLGAVKGDEYQRSLVDEEKVRNLLLAAAAVKGKVKSTT
jgi:copper homeostasis protein